MHRVARNCDLALARANLHHVCCLDDRHTRKHFFVGVGARASSVGRSLLADQVHLQLANRSRSAGESPADVERQAQRNFTRTDRHCWPRIEQRETRTTDKQYKYEAYYDKRDGEKS